MVAADVPVEQIDLTAGRLRNLGREDTKKKDTPPAPEIAPTQQASAPSLLDTIASWLGFGAPSAPMMANTPAPAPVPVNKFPKLPHLHLDGVVKEANYHVHHPEHGFTPTPAQATHGHGHAHAQGQQASAIASVNNPFAQGGVHRPIGPMGHARGGRH